MGAAAAAGALGTGLSSSACSGDDPGSGVSSAPSVGPGSRPGGISLPRLERPNVLFLAVDDMNDWAGFLNPHPGTSTPNMDALAATSLVFTRAYTPAPMCLPARTAVLWGRQPFETGVYDHTDGSWDAFHELDDSRDPLMTSFHDAGYETVGAGKITHDSNPRRWDDYRATEFYPDAVVRSRPGWEGRFDPEWRSPYDGSRIGNGERFTGQMVDFGPSGVSAGDQPDGVSAAWVCEQLRRDHDGPFLLAYGSTQPHTPWRVPQEFFDLHPLEGVVTPHHDPADLEDLSDYVRSSIIDNHRTFERIREAGIWREAVQAYQASISFADWCLGRILDELAASPHAGDTVVVIWSDHGFHLGEKGHWHKFTLWERATRVPFLIHLPGGTERHDVDVPVSLLDLGPTLADLCGVDLDPSHGGRSLRDLLADPTRSEDRPPLSTWMAGNHSVRQGPYRYIRYRTGDKELYDHRDDPDELRNIASDASVRELLRDLDSHLPRPG